MKGNLNELKKIRNLIKKGCNISVIILTVILLSACNKGDRSSDDEFEMYTEELFCREVSSNSISLHYTLKNPENYGIEEAELTLGELLTDGNSIRASCENMRQALLNFKYSELKTENKITYDILNYQLKLNSQKAAYTLYEEPLSLVSGVHTQLPVVFSEYQFYDRKDVDEYLTLLETTVDYFDDLIRFEREKASAGLFMPVNTAERIINQCRSFLDMGEGNYLYSTFVDRVTELSDLTEKEKSDYIKENARNVNDYIFPAYEKLINAVTELKNQGKYEGGLVFLPKGKAYYELLVKESTGSDKSPDELKNLTYRQMTEDLEAMENILGISADAAKEAAVEMGTDTPELILKWLEEEIQNTFPDVPETKLAIKYVPEEMEEHLSPAFYMIPAIDNINENVIYINQAHMADDITLFTTLAHEGYPGHLYQTVYFESTDPDPLRSILDFGGYVEGWATYAEMGSYYLTPLSKTQALLLQKNNSIILSLYALADIGIHYEGWSREDASSFFANYGITDTEVTDDIYELIIGSPANYLKYYIGYVEFINLKKEWVKEKGDDFSQKDFHQAVLSVGPAPFKIVENYMWSFDPADVKGGD